MLKETLAFIGGGNMARSLIGGLIAQGLPAKQIVVSDPMEAQRKQLAEQYGVQVTASNNEAAAQAQLIVLAVKPQELRTVAEQMAGSLGHRPLIISVAAGIRSDNLQKWLGGLPVVRTMPNRPALNGCGVTGMYANAQVTAPQRELAERVMGAVGKAVWVEQESLINAVTAVSGSGPAYFFLLMELLEAAGIEQGLPAETARTLAIETAYGSGVMAREVSDSPGTLREQVTSKGGTTEAALKVFAAANMQGIVSQAVKAATDRSVEMAALLGGMEVRNG
ncbi:MAG: pyrroline-5-carboxylate reductase [Steroidobacteraceae bacterium]